MTAPQEVNPNRRAFIILGAGLGVLLLFFLVTRLGGDDDSAEQTVAVPTTTVTPGAVTTIVPLPSPGAPGEAPVESFEVFNTKNPFVPLRAAAGSTGAAGGTTAGTTTGTGTTAAGTGSGSTAGAAGATGTGTTSGTGGATGTTGTTRPGVATEPRRGARVALLDVFSDAGKVVANVKVNDQVFKVTAGQTFGTNFQAVSLSQADDCGRFLFGDDQFRLCKGEETLK